MEQTLRMKGQIQSPAAWLQFPMSTPAAVIAPDRPVTHPLPHPEFTDPPKSRGRLVKGSEEAKERMKVVLEAQFRKRYSDAQ